MNGRRWKNEEIALLKKLIHEGKSTQEISSTLSRSESATKNKIYDLNISLNKCKNKNKHKYKKGEIVNGTLKIIEQTRVKNGDKMHRGYVVQSVVYPNAKTYEVNEYHLKNGTGCAYVAGRKVCNENSLWSVEKLRENIIDIEESKNIAKNSNKKVRFKCSTFGCDNTKTMIPKNLLYRGYSCVLCDTNVSYPERMMASYLKVKDIKFETQVMFNDTQRKIDFYIPSLNVYVETHGEQHYNVNDSWYRSSLVSDEIKRKWAKDNNKTLIELDCRNSTFEFIKESINAYDVLPNILESEKEAIVNNIKTSSKYDVQKIIRMYKDGLSAYKISGKLNISPNIIYNILKRNGVNRRTKNIK